MTHYNWDEALGEEDLLALTEEALTPPRRGRVPLRRLAALAACVGLVLGLVNYQAVAAGVQEIYRYFAGIGATTEDGDTLWVLEEPVTWTEGDWTYQIDGTLQGGTLELEIQVGTPLSLGQMPWYVTQRPGERSLGHRLTLTAGEEVLFDEYHGIALNSTLDALESSYYGYRGEQGFRTTGLTVVSCQMTEPPAEGCVLHIGGRVGMAEDREIPINLVPAETPPVVSQTWTLPEGEITILVAEDGSSLSAYFDSLKWHGWPFDITFIGESGINYPCNNMSGTFHLDGTELFEAIKPEHMDEPVAAVRIDGVSVARNTLGDPDHHWYEDLNWIIELPQ